MIKKKPAAKKARTTKVVNKLEKMIDWQKLAKDLQEALAKEMRENQNLEMENAKLVAEMYRHQGVITFLMHEVRRGNNSV